MEEFDVIVVGGGPAGSTAATLTAMQGHRVLLIERERFPRYHIGESLLPATVHGICEMLDAGDEMRKANFVVKHGGTFRWGRRPEPWTFSFGEAKYNSKRPSFAYQVERSRFDEILLRNAARKGVTVREEHSVKEVTFEGGRATGARYEDGQKRLHEARAQYVVDASGSAGLLANVIGERVYDRFFKNMALFGYFYNGKRFPEPERRGNVISAAFSKGWIWYIPLSDTLTSVGVVISRDHAADLSQANREQVYAEHIQSCPLVADFLSGATRVGEGQYAGLRLLKDFSYLNTKFWAPGAVAVGDAACFIDPVFSSGVHLATYSGMLAARSINTVLTSRASSREDVELDEQRCFAEFEQRYRREYGVFYEFLLGFYDMHQDEDSYFWRARKVLDVDESGRQSFVRLVAGLSNREEPLFDDAEAFIGSAHQRGQFLERLSDGAAVGEVSPELRNQAQDFGKVFFRERQHLWDIKQRKEQGAALMDDQKPIWEGGLVPTADGLRWRVPA
jgi:halogenation protein CepH